MDLEALLAQLRRIRRDVERLERSVGVQARFYRRERRRVNELANLSALAATVPPDGEVDSE